MGTLARKDERTRPICPTPSSTLWRRTSLADFLARVERGPVRSWVIDNAQAKPTGPGQWDLSFDITAYAQPPT